MDTHQPTGSPPNLHQRAASEVRAEMGRQSLSWAKLARLTGQPERWAARRFGTNPTVTPTLDDLQDVAAALGVPSHQLTNTAGPSHAWHVANTATPPEGETR